MEPIPAHIVQKQFSSLPQELKEFIADPQTTDILIEIWKECKIPNFLMESLGREVGYVLMGLRTPTEFGTFLTFLTLPKETEAGIVRSLNERIFSKFRQLISPSEATSNTMVTEQALRAYEQGEKTTPVVDVQKEIKEVLTPKDSTPGSVPPVLPGQEIHHSPLPPRPTPPPTPPPTPQPTPLQTPPEKTPVSAPLPSTLEHTNGQKNQFARKYAIDPYREPLE